MRERLLDGRVDVQVQVGQEEDSIFQPGYWSRFRMRASASNPKRNVRNREVLRIAHCSVVSLGWFVVEGDEE